MLVTDLLHSCTHEGVVAAAIASIGGDFAAQIQAQAEERGVSVGSHASGLVRSFAREASERDWRDLVEAVRGTDFPVLSGLKVILTHPSRMRRGAERGTMGRRAAIPMIVGAAAAQNHHLRFGG